MPNETPQDIIVTGASSQIGLFLLPRLVESGRTVHALGRNPPAVEGKGIVWHRVDLGKPPLPAIAAQCLIHLAPLPLLPPLVSALSGRSGEGGGLRRLIAFGSTSRFSKQASTDPHERAFALELAAAEQALAALCEASGIDWTVFRPTLIYGCGRDKNITVIADFIRKFGFFPLIGTAKGLRQPVHADDLAAACVSVIGNQATFNRAYDLSGGETLEYAKMVERIFAGLGKKPRFLPIPLPLFQAAIRLLSVLPRYRYLSAEMPRRMGSDLCFSHEEARRDFGYTPREFEPFV